MTFSIHLVSLHDSAANATVIPQHTSVVEVETVRREKPGVIERKRTMAPKMHVRQTFKKFSEQTVSVLYIRVEVRLPIRYKQTRDNTTHEYMSHAGMRAIRSARSTMESMVDSVVARPSHRSLDPRSSTTASGERFQTRSSCDDAENTLPGWSWPTSCMKDRTEDFSRLRLSRLGSRAMY